VQADPRPAAEAVLATRQIDRALAGDRGSSHAPLPGTRKEVERIAAKFGAENATVLLGSDASEQALQELVDGDQLRQYRYLHFATHGVLDTERPFESALILAQDNLPDPYEQYIAGRPVFDGRLSARQIAKSWNLDADLVTLSACDSGLGKRTGGEGMLGFSQALFAAGARSLVLSVWRVDDTATRLLMTRFYENLLGENDEEGNVEKSKSRKVEINAGGRMTKAEALKEAKHWLRNLTADEVRELLGSSDQSAQLASASGDRGIPDVKQTVESNSAEAADTRPFEHPYYWAAFILIGSPD
jgi:CHAT domain-containing protein